MAPTNKAQAAGVSSGSFLELRAQVAKQKENLSKGSTTAVAGGKKNGKVRCKARLFILFLALTNLSAHRSQVNGHFQTKAFRFALLVT
jgi:hypothetical protein